MPPNPQQNLHTTSPRHLTSSDQETARSKRDRKGLITRMGRKKSGENKQVSPLSSASLSEEDQRRAAIIRDAVDRVRRRLDNDTSTSEAPHTTDGASPTHSAQPETVHSEGGERASAVKERSEPPSSAPGAASSKRQKLTQGPKALPNTGHQPNPH